MLVVGLKPLKRVRALYPRAKAPAALRART
jgi:hypothetical protein